MMPPILSVVIPVYNGASRLPALFTALAGQQAEGVDWELIVINNASTDDTAAVIERFSRQWRNDVPFRPIFEPQKGAAYARQRGVDESRGHWVAFLDDDNRPDPDWVAAAVQFGRTHPRAGVFGGRTRLEIEGGVPPEFRRLGIYFCETNLGDQPRLFRPRLLQMPCGAGMVVNREAWRRWVPRALMFPDRAGNDFEAGLHIHYGGWEVWYVPSMSLMHEIDPRRLSAENLRRMMKLYGGQSFSLRLIGKRGWQRVETRLRVFLGGLYRMSRLLCLEGFRLAGDRFYQADLLFWISCTLSALRPAASPVGPSGALSCPPVNSAQNVKN